MLSEGAGRRVRRTGRGRAGARDFTLKATGLVQLAWGRGIGGGYGRGSQLALPLRHWGLRRSVIRR